MSSSRGQPRRLGFKPYVEGLDELLEGGVPEGAWVSVFGNPGSYKTLHSLAFVLSGLRQGEKAVYLSTEQSMRDLEAQLVSLGWGVSRVRVEHLTVSGVENGVRADLAVIDLDSLRYIAGRLNRLVREERGSGGQRRRWYWYDDPKLINYALLLGLEMVGAVERASGRDVKLEDVERLDRLRVKDGLWRRDAELRVDRDVRVRVVVDSVSPLFTARWSIAGRILTDMKVRLESPLHTYLIISHVPKSREEELGAEIGHIADGRIRLWNELDERARRGYVTGWIAKMRLTDHSRELHLVSIEKRGGEARLRWGPMP